MHILLIHQVYAGLNQYGGTRHSELANYLVEKGHQVTVIGSKINYFTGEHASREETSSGKVRFLGADTFFNPQKSYLHRIMNFISYMASSFMIGWRVKNIDLVWGTSPPLFQVPSAWLLSRIKGIPFIFEVRDLWPAFPVELGVIRNKFIIRLAEMVEGFFYKQSDQIVINSPGFLEHLVDKGVPQTKINIVPNGVDTRMFPENLDGDEFRERFDLEDSTVVLYAGAHGMANDLETVLMAAGQMQDIPEVVFVLVGEGKTKPSLMKTAQERGLTNIRFISAQPKTAMPGVLAASDLCLAILRDIPLFKTTYPNKVFDYMAAGKPTLLMIDGVIRDVVEDAKAGVFIPPGDPKGLADAIKLLVSQPDKMKEMGKSGREYLEDHFRRSDQADAMETIFLNQITRD